MVCSGMSLNASSKLNMALIAGYPPVRRPSSVPVRLIQEQGNIPVHPLLERGEAAVVACPAQIFDLGFGEILILLADRRRHIDVFDLRLSPERAEHGGDQIAKATRPARADIEDARNRRRVEEPAHDRDRIIDIDE